MVVENPPGVFKCERLGCRETVTADQPNNKRSRAQAERATKRHELKDAIHVSIVDLSTMSPSPERPDAERSGFAVILATTKGIEVLSGKISGRGDAEVEASILMQTLYDSDYMGQRRGSNRLPKPGSVIAVQQDRDNLHHINRLLAPPVIALKRRE